ncbi:T9SS type A sorting domain-containing protein [candidate division KSB1 bacterium]|nr:T9SS type A sorting domain-containing protein [candidate division KSB1 bacterium]
MTLPGTTSFHHWTGSDEAPQLRRDLSLNDWSIETNMELTQYTGEQFVIGLCVYFSASDMIYFGFANNTNTIKAFRTGAGMIAGASYSGGQIIDLRIVKIGSQYSLEFKSSGVTTWQTAGTYNESSIPADVGLVGNTWASIALSADFDYLRLTSSPSMNKQIFEMATETDIIPDKLAISQSYPNPFNMDTAIELQLPELSEVSVVIYNSRGQFIKQLCNQNIAAGTHRIHWDGTTVNGDAVSSGLYILHLRITDDAGKNEIYTRKLLLTK